MVLSTPPYCWGPAVEVTVGCGEAGLVAVTDGAVVVGGVVITGIVEEGGAVVEGMLVVGVAGVLLQATSIRLTIKRTAMKILSFLLIQEPPRL
jgi:hypothetical protein